MADVKPWLSEDGSVRDGWLAYPAGNFRLVIRDLWTALDEARADLSDMQESRDLYKGECQILAAVVQQITADRDALKAQLAKLAESGTGYSQETMNAIVKERGELQDALASARREALEEAGQLAHDYMDRQFGGDLCADELQRNIRALAQQEAPRDDVSPNSNPRKGGDA